MRVVTESTFSNVVYLDLAKLVKEELSIGESSGLDEKAVIRTIAKVLGKPPSYVRKQIAICELPSEILGLMRGHSVAPHVVLSLWHKAEANPLDAASLLKKAIANSEAQGVSKVMLKHAA